MARIVLGVGTSHSPMLTLRPDQWEEYAAGDRTNDELVYPPEGVIRTFEEGLRHLPDHVRKRSGTIEEYRRLHAACQGALDQLGAAMRGAELDAVVIVSDDQDEWFFEDNMPVFAVYWGDDVKILPRPMPRPRSPEIAAAIRAGYGDEERIHPCHPKLGRHLVEGLVARRFDVAHLTYRPPVAGGRVVRRYPTLDGESALVRETAPRPIGLPHGFSFVVKRLLHNMEIPIVPVFQNTCYPPNHVSPRRAYDFGAALGETLAEYPDDLRVAVVASGGLSHFVVDEELDRALLDALRRGDAAALRAMPRHRMYSATSESMNWIALGGAVAGTSLEMELIDYVPVYRTEAATGGGWAFALWQEPTRDAERSG
jgi:hypothetical protein